MQLCTSKRHKRFSLRAVSMAWSVKTLVIITCISVISILLLQFQLYPNIGQIRASTDRREYYRGLRDKLPLSYQKSVPSGVMYQEEILPKHITSPVPEKLVTNHHVTASDHTKQSEIHQTLVQNIPQFLPQSVHSSNRDVSQSGNFNREEEATRNLNYQIIKKDPRIPTSLTAKDAELPRYIATQYDTKDAQPISDESTTVSPGLVAEDHNARIQHLQHMCADKFISSDMEYNSGNFTAFFYNTEYNFAYCKVPKSASTFWMRLFMVLWKGDGYSKFISQWTRSEIHQRSQRLTVSPLKLMENKSPMVVVSRNPYSRLYSAYIDKIYLPLMWDQAEHMEGVKCLEQFSVNVTVRKRLSHSQIVRIVNSNTNLTKSGINSTNIETLNIKPICANDVSFEMFLKLIISEVEAKHILDPHWMPITFICRPCQFNTFKVVKQETFTPDVDHVLDAVGIDIAEYPSIKAVLHDRQAEASVSSIIGVVAKKAVQLSTRSCISSVEVARRLWASFHIQGYISDSVTFPEQEINKGPSLMRYHFKDLVLRAIEQKPLTSSEKKQQRWRHLVRAYSGVSGDIIKAIQHIYKHDFLLFNYSFDPPSLN